MGKMEKREKEDAYVVFMSGFCFPPIHCLILPVACSHFFVSTPYLLKYSTPLNTIPHEFRGFEKYANTVPPQFLIFAKMTKLCQTVEIFSGGVYAIIDFFFWNKQGMNSKHISACENLG